MKDTLHICTINTQGLLNKEKRLRLIEWSRQQKSDVLLLQETHFTQTTEPHIKTEYHGTTYNNYGTNNSRGVSIWVNNNIEFKLISKEWDEVGRLIMINIEINSTYYSLVNIYAPNIESKRKSFFKNIATIIKDKSTGNLIIGGDFNEIIECVDTKNKNKSKNNKKLKTGIHTFLKKH